MIRINSTNPIDDPMQASTGATAIYSSWRLGDEQTDQNSTMVERIEILTNQYGEFCKEIKSQPNRYNTYIYDLGDEEYVIQKPIFVLVEEYPEEENYSARFTDVELFGEGPTESEALRNLKLCILDLYDELASLDPNELGELPSGWLRILKGMITRS